MSKREIKSWKKWHVSSFSPRHRGVTRRREEEGETVERYVEQKDREVKGVVEIFFFMEHVILYYIGVRDDVFWTTEKNAPRFPRSFKKKKNLVLSLAFDTYLSLSLSQISKWVYIFPSSVKTLLSPQENSLSLLSLSPLTSLKKDSNDEDEFSGENSMRSTEF